MTKKEIQPVTQDELQTIEGGTSLRILKPKPLGQVIPGVDQLKHDFDLAFHSTPQLS